MKQKLTERQLADQQKKLEKKDRITRIAAIIFAFASVYYFFLKLVFL
jgi:uncharacterized membrane protein